MAALAAAANEPWLIAMSGKPCAVGSIGVVDHSANPIGPPANWSEHRVVTCGNIKYISNAFLSLAGCAGGSEVTFLEPRTQTSSLRIQRTPDLESSILPLWH